MFKVGDKVRVKKNLDIYSNVYPHAVKEMKKYEGKALKIKGIQKVRGNIIYLCHNNKWSWSEDMLEQINQSDENTDEVSTNLADFDQIKQFKKEDLRLGDLIKLRNHQEQFIYCNEAIQTKGFEYSIEDYDDDLKDKNYLTAFDIMKVERYIKTADGKYDLKTLYERKKEILDEKEKEYLKKVIEPFRKRIKKVILKADYDYFKYYIQIDFKLRNGLIQFPSFEKDTMYKNMELDKEYKLEELGL